MQKTILTKKTLTQKESQTFNVNQAGLTAIFISARCKKRDKLKVEVVGFSFDQIFNGSKLKGLKQTAVFILNLEAGEHQINLMPKGDPIIEEIKIIEFGENVTLNFNGLEEQAEDGDRRPFYTFVIINQEIKSCTIDASVSKRLKDSDDIKIKINGKERLNIFTPAKSKSKWRFWLWIGGLKERLQNKTYRESKTIELNLSKGNHFLEIIADRMPILHKVSLLLTKEPDTILATVLEEIRLRKDPTISDENVLIDKIPQGEQVIILERAIQGERPTDTATGNFYLSDRWHRVKYQDKEGYVYSGALEIEGESQADVQRFIEEKAKELQEDVNLMLAIAEQESDFRPYRISHTVDPNQGKGVMQLTDTTREQLKKLNYIIDDPFDFKRNIEGGIIYFKFIRTLFENNTPDYLEKLLIAWNAGPYCFLKPEWNKPLSEFYTLLSKETKIFIENTKKFYQRNQQENQNSGFVKIVLLITGAIISIFMIFLGMIYYLALESEKEISRGMIGGEVYQLSSDEWEDIFKSKNNLDGYGYYKIVRAEVRPLISSGGDIFKFIDDLDGDSKLEQLTFRHHYNQDTGRPTEVKFNNKQILDLQGSFFDTSSVSTLDIDKDGVKEIIIDAGTGTGSVWIEIFSYKNGLLDRIPVDIGAIANGFLGLGIKFIDYDDDGELEVVSPRRVSEICDAVSEVYEYREGRFILTNEITAYKPTCEQWVKEFKG